MEVQEDSGNVVTTVQLPMIREVGTTGTIIATVQVRTGCAYSTHERRYASELVHSTVLLVLLHKHVLSNHEYCTDTHSAMSIIIYIGKLFTEDLCVGWDLELCLIGSCAEQTSITRSCDLTMCHSGHQCLSGDRLLQFKCCCQLH